MCGLFICHVPFSILKELMMGRIERVLVVRTLDSQKVALRPYFSIMVTYLSIMLQWC